LIFAYVTPQIKWRFPDVSYGVYVYHAPIVFLAKERGLEGIPMLLVVCPVVFVLSLLSWYVIEGPILRWKDRMVLASRSRKSVTA
jgi:peptidoglycan/LPS O-acetylase OafA/YrhL